MEKPRVSPRLVRILQACYHSGKVSLEEIAAINTAVLIAAKRLDKRDIIAYGTRSADIIVDLAYQCTLPECEIE